MHKTTRRPSRSLLMFCLLVPAAASAESIELNCQITTDMAINHAGTRKDSSSTAQQRYTIDTEAKSVIMHFVMNEATKKWEETPKFLTDVRAATSKMVVFCDNDQTRCAPNKEISSDPARFSTLVTASPVIIDLASGKVSFTVQATRTHKQSGDWLSVNTNSHGTCTRG